MALPAQFPAGFVVTRWAQLGTAPDFEAYDDGEKPSNILALEMYEVGRGYQGLEQRECSSPTHARSAQLVKDSRT